VIKHHPSASNIAASLQILNSFPELVTPFISASFFSKLTNWFSIADISFVFQEIFLKMNSENHSYKILQNRIELDEAIGFLKKKYQMPLIKIMLGLLEKVSTQYSKTDNWISNIFKITFTSTSTCNNCTINEKSKISKITLNVDLEKQDCETFNLNDFLNNVEISQVQPCKDSPNGNITKLITITKFPEILLIEKKTIIY